MNIHTRRFIASALLYAFFGCLLGVLSSARPELIPRIRPVHTHINLLGWVSMMIIGVSYFVIPLFTRKKLFSDRLITFHFMVANVGIVGMVITSYSQSALFPLFALVEVLSAYLFLINIVLTVIKGVPLKSFPTEGKFLIGKNIKSVDLWAAKYTIASTLYFVIACTLGGYVAVMPSRWVTAAVHYHVNLMGWVTMMIFGVGYHIFPRFSRQMVRSALLVKVNFFTANAGILLMALAMLAGGRGGEASFWHAMILLAALLEGVAGLMFVFNILPSIKGPSNQMGKTSIRFAQASLTYFVAGIFLGFFMNVYPLHDAALIPVHAHLNVLGWITMMIFGVGYYIIPSFSGRKLYSESLANIHFWIANAGLTGFLGFYFVREGMRETVAFFALLELLAVILFIYNITMSLSRGESVR